MQKTLMYWIFKSIYLIFVEVKIIFLLENFVAVVDFVKVLQLYLVLSLLVYNFVHKDPQKPVPKPWKSQDNSQQNGFRMGSWGQLFGNPKHN